MGRGRLKERRSPLRPKVAGTPASGFMVLVVPVKLKIVAAASHRDSVSGPPPTGSALPGWPSGQGDTEGVRFNP